MAVWKKIKKGFINLWLTVVAYVVFLILLGCYFLRVLVLMTRKLKLHPEKLAEKIYRLMDKIDGKNEGEVSRIYLIELAIRNLKAKKMRAVVTIGGMAVGVAAVVFLVSLGYGLERLVISRVAKLDELKMIDVGMGGVTSSKMNDEVVAKIGKIEGVTQVIPAVSMVAKVTYKNSVMDLMSIGVDERYTKAIGVKMLAGNEMKNQLGQSGTIGMGIGGSGEVAGWSQEVRPAVLGESLGGPLSTFNIKPGMVVDLWNDCNQESGLAGEIVRQEGGFVGEEVWGERYVVGDDRGIVGQDKKGTEYSVWVKTKAPLWQKDGEGAKPVIGNNSYQEWAEGCVMEPQLAMEGNLSGYNSLDNYLEGKAEIVISGQVLGESTTATGSAEATESAILDNADFFGTEVSTDSAGVQWVDLKQVTASDSAQKKQLTFSDNPSGEAYISSGMLKVFGLTKDKVLGENFGVSFIVPDGLIPDVSGRLESQITDFKVVGVVDDATSNYFYFNLVDAQKLGIKNYSQLKVFSSDQESVARIRKEIESTGLTTTSALDTVAEIEKLFGTLRLVLGLLGTIALAVAALGMFNTMTVSLLERTREVGVMKAMGMLSDDVRELFLAESMIMGISGGVCGVLLGVLGGKLVSIILTSISVIKGQGTIDISYVPFFFTAFILLISFLVGVMTGWYPSRRARQISALNALRYE